MTNVPPTRRAAAVAALVAVALTITGIAVAVTSGVDRQGSAATGPVTETRVRAFEAVTGSGDWADSSVLAGQGRGRAVAADVVAVGSRAAPNTAGALPRELTVGRNADVGVDVYQGVSGGKPVSGITNDLGRRATQHGDRFDDLAQVTTSSVTRGQARAIEEALIRRNRGQNLRHEISPSHSLVRRRGRLGR